jgi:hypothetical protein
MKEGLQIAFGDQLGGIDVDGHALPPGDTTHFYLSRGSAEVKHCLVLSAL